MSSPLYFLWCWRWGQCGGGRTARWGPGATLTSTWTTDRLYPPVPLPPQPCFALSKPGRLVLNLTSPLHTDWRPLDEATCAPLPSYLPALWSLSKGPDVPFPAFPIDSYTDEYRLVAGEPLPRPDHSGDLAAVNFLLARRKGPPPTVLILGDSVDRNGLVHFCQLMDQQVVISLYDDIKARPELTLTDLTKGHGPRFKGWDQRGLPHLCEVPLFSPDSANGKDKGKDKKVAMRVVNGFQYGMDALDEFDTPDHLDWHKPGRIENRIDELFVPFLEQMGGTDAVDLVVLHSGMWDLVRPFLLPSLPPPPPPPPLPRCRSHPSLHLPLARDCLQRVVPVRVGEKSRRIDYRRRRD